MATPHFDAQLCPGRYQESCQVANFYGASRPNDNSFFGFFNSHWSVLTYICGICINIGLRDLKKGQNGTKIKNKREKKRKRKKFVPIRNHQKMAKMGVFLGSKDPSHTHLGNLLSNLLSQSQK